MKIEINGELKEFDNPINLKSLIDSILNNTKGMAVALNNTVVPQSQWTDTELKEADKILLIRAIQGG
jgi:sulfur carrier protein